MKRKGSNAEGSQVSVGETVSRTRCATILYYHLPKFSVSHLIFRRSAEMFNWSWRCATAEHSSDGLKINVQLLLILHRLLHPTDLMSKLKISLRYSYLVFRRIRMALFHLRYWISTSWVIIFPSLPVSFYSRRDPLSKGDRRISDIAGLISCAVSLFWHSSKSISVLGRASKLLVVLQESPLIPSYHQGRCRRVERMLALILSCWMCWAVAALLLSI